MTDRIDEIYNVIMKECSYSPVVGPEALGPVATTFRCVLTDDAAVAAAVTGDIAVVGPGGEEIPIAMTNAGVKQYILSKGTGIRLEH